MAGRFVFQNLASRMSRSTSRLSTHVSASARAIAPIISSHPSSARYLSTFSCSPAAAKAGWPTGMPSIVTKKTTFLDSAGRMKRTWSSGPSDKLGHSSGANLAAWRARGSAWLAKMIEGRDEDLNKSQ